MISKEKVEAYCREHEDWSAVIMTNGQYNAIYANCPKWLKNRYVERIDDARVMVTKDGYVTCGF